MTDYDFKTLSSYDFESLVHDLLQLRLGVPLESFKDGKDGGIDLRYCKPKSDTPFLLVVQCKRYNNFSDLYRHLSKIEKPKVDKIRPSRYVLAVSTPLSPQQKDKLYNIFHQYCDSPGDIYGQRDLNGLLREFPEVEKNHFKLWLTSVAFLERIQKSDTYNYTDFTIIKAVETLKKYVENDSFDTAKSILEDKNCCIISGGPGVGKSTLAEMLLLYYFNIGYNVYNVDNMNNAFYFTNPKNNNSKNFIYYDVFLAEQVLPKKYYPETKK
ncbi:MAG: restriction endonuclease [Chloroflexota bacterium]|nr:restriction endonuclease [Chloroflexota bacterium]